MSYYALQQTSGLGAPPGSGGWYAGLGRSSWYAGLGADSSFNASQVWNDWVAGAPPPSGQGNNAAGKRAALAIQAALSTLGFADASGNPLVVDGSWGPKSGQAWTKFIQKYNLQANGIYPTQAGVAMLGQLLAAGSPVGPDKAVTQTQVAPGVFLPSTGGGTAKAGMLAVGGIALAAAVVGLAVMMGKKKHRPESHATTTHAV